MDDLISRTEATAELDHAAWGKDYDKALAKAMLESLPSAQPKNGKWEEIKVIPASEIELQSARCSACKRYHTTPYLYNYTHYKFCPNCGARMVSEDEID